MATKDRTQIVQVLLEASDRAFDAGDHTLGSLKLWEATECALSIVSESWGWPCRTEDDHFDLLHRLQADTGKFEDPDIVSGYLVAAYYRQNAGYNFMEDYVLKGGIEVVHRLVNELLSFAG
ncbi:MAG: hypothetical protein J4G13_01540 [Dehalococcoidia bacterium]|nr:hypothetical protein [Dehalococcoidia bacterium]